MPCPTCDHTLTMLCPDEQGRRYYYCDRCGTVVVGERDVYRPTLVDRCREFAATLNLSELTDLWDTLGIAESINTPDNR